MSYARYIRQRLTEVDALDYQGQHKPSGPNEGAALYDLTMNHIYPKDVYTGHAWDYLLGDRNAVESMNIALSSHNRPNRAVKIYRAVPYEKTNAEKLAQLEKQMYWFMARRLMPAGVPLTMEQHWYDTTRTEIERLKQLPNEKRPRLGINPGDWVTIRRSYATEHGRSHLNGNYRVISKMVFARDLYTDGNSIDEWGYYPTPRIEKNPVAESTRPYVKKIVDPALLTYEEYYQIANPHNKSHPYDSYDWTAEQLHNKGYLNREEFPIYVNRIRLKDQMFEIRLQTRPVQYVKRSPDGNLIYDENRNIVYMTDDEVRAMGKETIERTWAVYNEQGMPVASIQDEWGAILIAVAQEYRNYGLGLVLGKIARTQYPGKSSGGFTPQGKGNFRALHAEFVKDYLRSGMYSYLVQSGQITVERAKKIIASTKMSPEDREDHNTGRVQATLWNLWQYDKPEPFTMHQYVDATPEQRKQMRLQLGLNS